MLLLLLQLQAAAPADCSWAERPDTSWTLPAELEEISGIVAVSPDRLLAHDDERGRLVAIDPRTGRLVGEWALRGEPADDFEGIALVGTTVYLLTSRGTLYTTSLPTAPGTLAYTRHDTRLGDRCEFEGLAAERGGQVLLLGCKVVRGQKKEMGLRIYRWDVTRRALARPELMEISSDTLKARTPWRRFQTSALEVDTTSGNIFVLSARAPGLIELTSKGALVASHPLSRALHPQPEGLARLPGPRLLVSDEAAGGQAKLSVYSCRP
jgi:uncharacterized protein YjiK